MNSLKEYIKLYGHLVKDKDGYSSCPTKAHLCSQCPISQPINGRNPYETCGSFIIREYELLKKFKKNMEQW